MAQMIDIGSRATLEIDGATNEFLFIESGDPTQYKENTITADSQIGNALIGKAVGDVAEIIIEGRPRVYRVREIR